MEYQVAYVHCSTLAHVVLAEKVNGLLADGWRPQGGVAAAEVRGVPVLCQAMVRDVSFAVAAEPPREVSAGPAARRTAPPAAPGGPRPGRRSPAAPPCQ
jgi:hypothetical protein